MDVNGDCGKNEERHTPTDITLSDLTAAAKGHDREVEQAADNMISGALAQAPALTPISGSVARRALLHPATVRVSIEERVVVSRAGAL